MNKHSQNSRNQSIDVGAKEKGATIVEFCLVSITLFLIVFAIIDYSRYFWTRATLIKATQSAARTAASIDGFDENIYVLKYGNWFNEANDNQAVFTPAVQAFRSSTAPADIQERARRYNKYYTAQLEVEEAAYRVARHAISHSRPKSMQDGTTYIEGVNLVAYHSPIIGETVGSARPNRVSDIAIIRPGDGVLKVDQYDGSFDLVANDRVFHPTLCGDTTGQTTCDYACTQFSGSNCDIINDVNLPPNERIRLVNLDTLYRNYPIVIEMRATVDTIIPWIGGSDGKLDVVARAFAYREVVPDGSEPASSPASLPCPTAPPPCAGVIINCVCHPPTSSSSTSSSSSSSSSSSTSGSSSSSTSSTTSTSSSAPVPCGRCPRLGQYRVPPGGFRPNCGTCNGGVF